MEDSYTKQINHYLSLIDDVSFKERLTKLCEFYSSLEVGLKIYSKRERLLYNILITQEMNTIKDIESICTKINFVLDKIRVHECSGCEFCAPDKQVANDNIFH